MLPVFGVKFCGYDEDDNGTLMIERLREDENRKTGFMISRDSVEAIRVVYTANIFGKSFNATSKLGNVKITTNPSVNSIQVAIDENQVLSVKTVSGKICEIDVMDTENADILISLAYVIILLSKE